MKSNGNGFEELVAIQLAVRSWPGQAKLSAEDWGSRKMKSRRSSGWATNAFTPEEWRQTFNQLAGKARSYLNDHSFPFVVEYVRAIPKRNLDKVVQRLEELKAEYLAKADEFVAHYEAIQDHWREKYADIWPRLAPHYPTKSQLRRKFDYFLERLRTEGCRGQGRQRPSDHRGLSSSPEADPTGAFTRRWWKRR